MKRATLWGAEIVNTRFNGIDMRATRRTLGHLRSTVERLRRKHPRAKLVILQPCYNTGVRQSAGTHDFDAVLDVEIEGISWQDAQKFLRECGWAAWWRHTGTWEDPGAWHIHMCSIPPNLPAHPSAGAVLAAYHSIGIEVGEFVPGQVADFYAHAFGLKGQHNSGSDRSWFPPDINSTVFKEDDMGYLDWPEEDRKALRGDVAKEVVLQLRRMTLGKIGTFGGVLQAIYTNTKKGTQA